MACRANTEPCVPIHSVLNRPTEQERAHRCLRADDAFCERSFTRNNKPRARTPTPLAVRITRGAARFGFKRSVLLLFILRELSCSLWFEFSNNSCVTPLTGSSCLKIGLRVQQFSGCRRGFTWFYAGTNACCIVRAELLSSQARKGNNAKGYTRTWINRL